MPGMSTALEADRKRELKTRQTKAKLWESLLALMSERNYKTIFVSDIVGRAKVNRATFYRYYEDKDDLFRQGCIELFNSVNARLPPTSAVIKDIEAIPSCFQLMFPILEEERETFLTLFGPNGNPDVLRLFTDRIEYFFVEDQLKHWDAAFGVFDDPEIAELFACGVASLLMTFIVKWLSKPETLDDIIKVYKTLVWGSVKELFSRKDGGR
jgi:Transcriptional regulator